MTNSARFTSQDLTSLYRNSIGVDKLFENLFSRHQHQSADANYPPYNIIALSEDQYIIEIAIAGFDIKNINITAHNSQLIIKGNSAKEQVDVHYLHQGISGRQFKRVFELAEYVEVQDADFQNGILIINLQRIVPDSALPKEIKISTAAKVQGDLDE